MGCTNGGSGKAKSIKVLVCGMGIKTSECLMEKRSWIFFSNDRRSDDGVKENVESSLFLFFTFEGRVGGWL